jgi:GTP-binding protein Era
MKSGHIAFVGRPNAGKSTLLNALVGSKIAIVSDKPQTTRTRILGVKTLPDAQLVFVDTPGVHRPLHRLNVRMVDAAVDAVRHVDVVALVVDAAETVGAGTRFLLDLVADLRAPVVLVLNKIDLVAKTALLPRIDWFRQQRSFAEIVPVSALTGDGVEALERVLVQHLPEGEAMFPDDYLTDQPERVIASELVREQVLVHTRDELPFATAVVIDGFEEVSREDASRAPASQAKGPEGKGPQGKRRQGRGPQETGAPDESAGRDLLRIYCSILVDRESQKPILIGRAGDMIKRIGTAARLELERFFATRVYLDLQVKVRPDWRENERVLDDIGVERGRPRSSGRRPRPAGKAESRRRR